MTRRTHKDAFQAILDHDGQEIQALSVDGEIKAKRTLPRPVDWATMSVGDCFQYSYQLAINAAENVLTWDPEQLDDPHLMSLYKETVRSVLHIGARFVLAKFQDGSRNRRALEALDAAVKANAEDLRTAEMNGDEEAALRARQPIGDASPVTRRGVKAAPE